MTAHQIAEATACRDSVDLLLDIMFACRLRYQTMQRVMGRV